MYLRYSTNGIVTVTTGVSTAEVRANTLVVSGVSTLTGTTNIGDLDVDGHTNLDHVSISGVTTFASATRNNFKCNHCKCNHICR